MGFLQLFRRKNCGHVTDVAGMRRRSPTSDCNLCPQKQYTYIFFATSIYVDFNNAVRALYCPTTVLSPHQWNRYKQPLQLTRNNQ